MTPRSTTEREDTVTLTSVERDALWEAIERAFLDMTTHDRACEDDIEHAVEAIIAARLAP